MGFDFLKKYESKKEEDLLKEEEILLKKLEEIRLEKQRIEEERKRKEEEERRKQPTVIEITKYSSGYAYYHILNPKPEVTEILKKFGYNSFYISVWKNVKESLKDLNVIFKNHERLDAPLYKIKDYHNKIIIQWNPVTNHNGRTLPIDYYKIPGCTIHEKGYLIPPTEAYRLFTDLKLNTPEFEGKVEWENGIFERIQTELDKKLKVIELHTAEDADVDFTFKNNPDFKLRPHQKVAIKFSELVEGKSIVVYSPGTGKTAISIADSIIKESERTVVICPASLRLNWKNHIKNLTGENAIILSGRKPTDHDMRFLLLQKPKFVIINYDILRTKEEVETEISQGIKKKVNRYWWVELINLYMPDYIIADECQYAKNPSAQQSIALRMLDSKYKMALSGTPIINRQEELWPILNWLYPDVFRSYEHFIQMYGGGSFIYNTESLRSLLETIVIKRNRKDINKNLPPINRIVETHEMSPRARKIYDRILDGIFEKMAELDHLGKGGEKREVEFILPKLNYMIQVCAADKTDHTVELAQKIVDSYEDDEPHNKVIIFTKFKGTCNTIARKLGGEALSFVRRTKEGFITLTMEERMDLVHQFQTDPYYKYLVCTTGTAREGLDMTKAGVVIFNDLAWSPAHHTQCEGRAFYREIDMHGGDSYYLQFENTIEEEILNLHGIKQNIVDQVIENKGGHYSVTSEIIERLREAFRKRKK